MDIKFLFYKYFLKKNKDLYEEKVIDYDLFSKMEKHILKELELYEY